MGRTNCDETSSTLGVGPAHWRKNLKNEMPCAATCVLPRPSLAYYTRSVKQTGYETTGRDAAVCSVVNRRRRRQSVSVCRASHVAFVRARRRIG